MTAYDIAESSIESGEPVELFRFDYGNASFTYTSGDTTVQHSGSTYTPEPIRRSELQLTADMEKSLLKLTTTKNNEIVQLFTPGTLSAILFVTVYRQHTTATDANYVVLYKGRVTSCNTSEVEAVLTCEPIFTSLKRQGLRRTYEPSCPLMLYSPACKVDKSLFAVTGPVSGFDGKKQLTVAAASTKADGWFTGGIVIAEGKPHMIANHIGSTLTLMRHMQGSTITGDVTLYPGCDHTRTTCATKFNNILNYAGFAWMSARNPFTGDSVHWITGS